MIPQKQIMVDESGQFQSLKSGSICSFCVDQGLWWIRLIGFYVIFAQKVLTVQTYENIYETLPPVSNTEGRVSESK